MDKAKTLEVLRGMKFMQRKEEAKRRATFEVAQREEIEHHLHADSTSGTTAAPGKRRGGPARATVLYDDALPSNLYGLARRSFTDTLGEPSDLETLREVGKDDGVGTSSSPTAAAGEHNNDIDGNAVDSGEEEVEDLWGSEDASEGDDKKATVEEDPTAAPGRHLPRKKKSAAHRHTNNASKGGRHDGRFTVQAAVRAPKLPRRLEEAIAEEERQRKRRRAEDDGDVGS
ncbi:hypothetical protein ABB37_05590 [Leptomonas pyrrhocoris]|uniref:Uncharacterized protein n=1 Tax=Leptomonas pyrrhocoris TaxID=157538 RepID=A0A0M9FZE8_LEPPY|nr:hypothetical protein ABB37_05590 [Leptomonas pyrrhocoris]KPA79057.1 hypothetical protein ABB37_05590 [Leptomonas pyrrhocoris]|eukprot:XP_015657496.1 hypothetical protein ABB37_05590 [Leptomonas pyrrhocoris]